MQTLTLNESAVHVCIIILIAACSGQANETTINLLLLVPWAESDDQGYGPGPDLYSGARVAVGEVNNNSNILPGYRINLIESRHEACGQIQSSQGLINIVQYAINPHTPVNVAAIMGLYCSTSTRAISPVASKFDIIQLTVANSPTFRHSSYPHLWHFIEFASNYADMMLAIMDQFQWTRIAVVNEFVNVFLRDIGDTLVEAIESSPDKQLLYHGRLTGSGTGQKEEIGEVLAGIRENGAFVIFLSLSVSQAVQLLCEAGRYNMHWPNYVWVIADDKAETLFSFKTRPATCSSDLLNHTIENAITSVFSLEPDNPFAVLVSNDTYCNYKSKYECEHQRVVQEYGANLTSENGDFLYGSVAYDQVWAFSLALHSALPELKKRNISIENYGYGQPEVTAILERHLGSVDFSGSSGRIRFNNTQARTVSTIIQVFQVRNFIDARVGMFDSSDTDAFFINISNPPPDFVKPHTILIPMPLAVGTWIILFIFIVLVTVNLVLMWYYNNHGDIKATSPLLNCEIVMGCYLECISAALFVMQVSVEDPPILGFTALCNIELFLGMYGMYLILLTALLRLIRIFHVFRIFYSPTKLDFMWKDTSLFIIVLCISNYATVIFIIWIPVDELKFSTSIKYYTDSFPIHAERVGVCTCQYYWVWLGLLYALVWILLVVLILFAVKTRKIERKSFKDTKKINILAFIMSTIIIMFCIIHQVLIEFELYHYAYFVLGLLFASVCLIAQCVLLMPKVFPLLYNRCRT